MSKSTSIDSLPKNGNDGNDEESMMVNSILEEIQQEDERINDENEDSLKYTMDTSQIPPKINESVPSKEMIQEATKDLFEKQNSEVTEILNSINEKQDAIINKEDIKDNNMDIEETNIIKTTEKNIEKILNKVMDKAKIAFIILIFFILLNLPILNKYIIKCIPKFSDGLGNLNIMAVIFKGIILSLIYFGISFCI